MVTTGEYGTWGSSKEHKRYMVKVSPRSRVRCWCGCKQRATHIGMANGVALTTACELGIRRWIKTDNVITRSKP